MRRAHRARVVAAAGDQAREGAQLLLGRRPGEHVVLRPLELGGAEGERVVAGDVGVQVAGRVLPLVLERRLPGGFGTDWAITVPFAVDDLAAWLVELAADGAGVVERRLELLLAPDLPVVERDEERDVADHQPDARAGGSAFMAFPGHAGCAVAVRDAARGAPVGLRRRSRHAAHRSAGRRQVGQLVEAAGAGVAEPDQQGDEDVVGHAATSRRS